MYVESANIYNMLIHANLHTVLSLIYIAPEFTYNLYIENLYVQHKNKW